METPDSIRAFWFGSHPDDALVMQERSRLWWAKNAEADHEIKRRFEAYVGKAANGALDSWAQTAAGRLALILLTDQFPRNMYRGLPQAFAFDPAARAWCKDGIRAGHHLLLRPVERVFFYLPLEHSESLDDQHQAVALFTELLAGVGPGHKPQFEGFLDFALRHRAIVARFGRFPHRNQVLGRTSSPQEQAFLKEKGSSF